MSGQKPAEGDQEQRRKQQIRDQSQRSPRWKGQHEQSGGDCEDTLRPEFGRSTEYRREEGQGNGSAASTSYDRSRIVNWIYQKWAEYSTFEVKSGHKTAEPRHEKQSTMDAYQKLGQASIDLPFLLKRLPSRRVIWASDSLGLCRAGASRH